MTASTVILPDSTRLDLEQPYGHEIQMKQAGKFEATVVLSPINQRLHVLDFSGPDHAALVAELQRLALLNGFGKVWLKALASGERALVEAGFEIEARIPRYFKGEDAILLALFPLPERRLRPAEAEEEAALKKATNGPPKGSPPPLPEGYRTALFTAGDAPALTRLYAEVFPTYPFPITDPAYLIRTAETNIAYRLVWNAEEKLVAAASAETSPTNLNAEMTDFAALPSERGKGLALHLLFRLEDDARERFGTQCFYTIARAAAPGMVRTFHHAGYVHSGTLVNNCSIAGGFETMLVLHRP